jgi:hypothetical protein
MPVVLNVGLDPAALERSTTPSEAFPRVDAKEVRDGLEASRAALAELGLDFETCLIDRGPAAEDVLRRKLQQQHFDIIMFGGGVRLEPSLTHLFEVLINCAIQHSPRSTLCFNTGPDTTVEAVQRWWPERTPLRLD